MFFRTHSFAKFIYLLCHTYVKMIKITNIGNGLPTLPETKEDLETIQLLANETARDIINKIARKSMPLPQLRKELKRKNYRYVWGIIQKLKAKKIVITYKTRGTRGKVLYVGLNPFYSWQEILRKQLLAIVKKDLKKDGEFILSKDTNLNIKWSKEWLGELEKCENKKDFFNYLQTIFLNLVMNLPNKNQKIWDHYDLIIRKKPKTKKSIINKLF